MTNLYTYIDARTSDLPSGLRLIFMLCCRFVLIFCAGAFKSSI